MKGTNHDTPSLCNILQLPVRPS